MIIFRVVISFIVGFFALLNLVVVFDRLVPNEKRILSSINRNKEIYSEFQIVGKYTQSHLLEKGRLPTYKELSAWGQNQKLQGTIIEGYHVSIPESGCGVEPENMKTKHTYSLCYWRSEWMEVYSPETGETTLGLLRSD